MFNRLRSGNPKQGVVDSRVTVNRICHRPVLKFASHPEFVLLDNRFTKEGM